MTGLADIRNILSSRLSNFTRIGMTIRPHFVPLNLKALDVTLGSLVQEVRKAPIIRGKAPLKIDLHSLQSSIAQHVVSKYPNTIVLTGKQVIVNGRADIPLDIAVAKFTPAVVYSGYKSIKHISGVLFSSQNAASSDLLNNFLNTEFKSFLSEELRRDTSFDLAYVLQHETPETAGLGDKIRKLFGVINSVSNNTVHAQGVAMEGSKASLVQTKVMVESLLSAYTENTGKATAIEATISKETSAFINKIKADILIIQDEFDTVDVVKEITSGSRFSKLADMIANLKIGPRSFIQDITDRITSIFTTGKSGKQKKASASIDPIKSQRKDRVTVGMNHGKSVNQSLPKGGVSSINLQALINAQLYETVKKNMGSGDSKDILNFRSGRLAKSFNVTAVSKNRSQALTVFFTYLKYPYATFSPGGEQRKPVTRNPKFLGEKSIREIAAKHVSERLRVVLI